MKDTEQQSQFRFQRTKFYCLMLQGEIGVLNHHKSTFVDTQIDTNGCYQTDWGRVNV